MIELYYEALDELYTTKFLLESQVSPLTLYNSEIIDGPMIDIGCGSASMLLDFAKSDRELFAIDTDLDALVRLEARVREIDQANIDNWKFLQLEFFGDQLPNHEFSIVNLSMLLHFFTIDKCSTLANQLLPITRTGSLVCVSVHSDRHSENKSDNANRFSYFKHYFSETDLDNLFPSEQFYRLYFDNTIRRLSGKELDVIELWGRKMILAGFPRRANDEIFLKEKAVEFRKMKKDSELVTTLNAIYVRK